MLIEDGKNCGEWTSIEQIHSEWDFLKQKVVIARNNKGKIM